MIGNLQLLRALAATCVVFYHCVVIGEKYGISSVFSGQFHGWGAAGVDLFFVISGFIMVVVQNKTPRRPMTFMANRIARIVPLYWLLTLAIIALMAVLPSAFNGTLQFDLQSLKNLLQSLFFISGQWDRSPVLYVGWTLEFEMFFYLTFAVGILTGNLTRGAVLVTGIILVMLTMGLTKPIALEFIFGMGCGLLWIHGRLPRVSQPILWAMIAATLAIVVFLSPVVASQDFLRPLLWGFPAAGIVAAALGLSQIRRGFWTFLGDTSYSIYLIQVFTIPFFYKTITRIPLELPGEALIALSTVFSVAIGIGVGRYIEAPLTRATTHFIESATREARALLPKELS